MKWRGHRQHHGALGAALRRDFHGALHRLRDGRKLRSAPENSDSPATPPVRSAAFLQISATCAASSPRIAAIAPSPAGTASCMYCPRCAHQPHRVGKIQPAGRHQRGIFAQAVPRDKIRADSALLEHAIRRHRYRQNRGLRVLGQLQRFFGTVEAQIRNRKSQRLVRFVKHRRAMRENFRPDPGPCRDIATPAPETKMRVFPLNDRPLVVSSCFQQGRRIAESSCSIFSLTPPAAPVPPPRGWHS